MKPVPQTRRLVMTSLGFALLGLTACGKNEETKPETKPTTDPKTAPAAQQRVYVVGTNANFAPFE